MADGGSELGMLKMVGEAWNELSKGEKAWLSFLGVLAAIAVISHVQEVTGNDSDNIPTAEQIKEKQEQLEKIEHLLNDTKTGAVTGANAELWKKRTEEALARIEGFRHEQFAPGAVTEIREALDNAAEFSRSGMQQAANQTLSQAWQLARITEIKVLEAEKAWEEAAVVYLSCHGGLQKVLDNISEMPVEFTTDQGKESITMDADFWSEGRVSRLVQTMPEEELPRTASVEQVEHWTQQLRDLAQTLSNVLEAAVDAFRTSQERLELCNAVYNSFLDRGWILDETAENGFEKDDPRKDAFLHLCSAAQDKLEFTFSGASNIELKPRFKGVHNQGLKTYLENMLRQVLSENGFTLTQLTSSF